MFNLDPRLKDDCHFICDLKISRLLLMDDANYYWLILVPRRDNLVEISDLDFDEQVGLLAEINMIAKILKKDFKADKINIAALGNVVKQLHIHVIGRFENDISFPQPVWGAKPAKPYVSDDAQQIITKLKCLIKL